MHFRLQGSSYAPFSEGWLGCCRLPAERLNILQLAGVEMDIYSGPSWKTLAHQATKFLTGAVIPYSEEAVMKPALPIRYDGVARQRRYTESAHGDSDAEAAEQSLGGAVMATAHGIAESEAGVASFESNTGVSSSCSSGRMPVLRWALTQRALAAERRLGPEQFRYLTVLGKQAAFLITVLYIVVSEVPDRVIYHMTHTLGEVRSVDCHPSGTLEL